MESIHSAVGDYKLDIREIQSKISYKAGRSIPRISAVEDAKKVVLCRFLNYGVHQPPVIGGISTIQKRVEFEAFDTPFSIFRDVRNHTCL